MTRSDIQLAQMASIAKPDDPVRLQFTDCGGGCDGYRLEHLSGEIVSMNGPIDEVVFGVGRAVSTGPVSADVTPQNSMEFDGLGGLSSPYVATLSRKIFDKAGVRVRRAGLGAAVALPASSIVYRRSLQGLRPDALS